MNVPEEVSILIDGLDEADIDSLLEKWQDIDNVKRKIVELEEVIKNKIKSYLKERKWERYMGDKNKISVTLSKVKKTSYDMEQLKMTLSEEQIAKITKITTYEKMSIITKEMRKRLEKNVNWKNK